MKFDRKKISLFSIITLAVLVIGIFTVYAIKNEEKKAKFINVEPSVILNEIEYIVTNEHIEESKLEKQAIGKITEIDAVVSYLEEDNPYKNPNRIYKIKDIDIESKIAIEMNDKTYLAIKKGGNYK